MKFLLLPLLVLLTLQASSQLWVQDFETNGLNTAYTSPSVFTTNLNGHYNRTNGSNISNTVAPYSNKHGNFVWAGENLHCQLKAATQDDGSCVFVTNPTTCPEDIDGNSTVGVSDLLLFIAAYGTNCN